MPSTAPQLFALARDISFVNRLASLLSLEAQVTLNDEAATDADKKFALTILSSPTNSAIKSAYAIASATNLAAATTTYNFALFVVETSASDAEIRSQIRTLWGQLSGIAAI